MTAAEAERALEASRKRLTDVQVRINAQLDAINSGIEQRNFPHQSTFILMHSELWEATFDMMRLMWVHAAALLREAREPIALNPPEESNASRREA